MQSARYLYNFNELEWSYTYTLFGLRELEGNEERKEGIHPPFFGSFDRREGN